MDRLAQSEARASEAEKQAQQKEADLRRKLEELALRRERAVSAVNTSLLLRTRTRTRTPRCRHQRCGFLGIFKTEWRHAAGAADAASSHTRTSTGRSRGRSLRCLLDGSHGSDKRCR